MADSPLATGDHYFEADGVRFHYLVRGTGPVMIVQSMGWGMPGGFVWNGLGPHVEKTNTAVYIEPRGNGESSRPADPATMTAKTMAEDLEHLRKHLGLDVLPVLVGGSHAGAIALRYAERYPARVAKLILFSSQVMDSPPNTNTQDWIAKRKDDPAYAPAITKLMELVSSPPTTDEDLAAGMAVLFPWYFSDPTKGEALSREFLAGTMKPSVYGFQTNINDAKPENKLPHVAEAGKVEAKTLIVWGDEDTMCSLTAAHAIADGIKGSKLVILPGAGHCAWVESPDAFWGAVNAFLES